MARCILGLKLRAAEFVARRLAVLLACRHAMQPYQLSKTFAPDAVLWRTFSVVAVWAAKSDAVESPNFRTLT